MRISVKVASAPGAFLALLMLALAGASAQARNQIRIVGSSTLYPFTTTVAEHLGKARGIKTPVVEATGTGGGLKLFCEGVGERYPDATNASRRIKKSELEACEKNGVGDIIEMMVGYDGLTLALSKKAPPLQLSRAQVFLALAREVPGPEGTLVPNPYRRWRQIDPRLPDTVIEVLGPPPTSGTRDSLHEMVLEGGAAQIPALRALKAADPKAFERAWKTIREDGPYVEAGENDNVIVQKLEANPNAIGVFGFSFLEENVARIQGVALDGVAPQGESIAARTYPAAREMFVYLKKAHIGPVPGLEAFAAEYVSDKAAGEGGYLERKGLVPQPGEKLEAARRALQARRTLQASELP